jgi:hypothetical protein
VLQELVAFELELDLVEEAPGYGSGVAEDRDGDFGVAEDLLDDPGEGDDRRLVVEPGPEVEVAVRGGLYLPAARVEPVVPDVGAAQALDEQVVAVNQAQGPERLEVLAVAV